VGDLFERRNIAGSVFRDVSLRGSVFEDVNLAEATIHNATLENARIEGSYIKGLTIDGICVDELIEAELDRRDPERLRLRIRDIHDPPSVLGVMARLEQLRSRFRELLRSAAPKRLATHPSANKWSALENVRHLLFAEDLYLNRLILQNRQPLDKLGLLPAHLVRWPGFEQVGSTPSEDLETILAAWDGVHAGTQAFLSDLTPERLRGEARDLGGEPTTVGEVLQRLAQHDLHHIRSVEAVLARAES
jgi:uncharacterized damage-inducible protein DinB